MSFQKSSAALGFINSYAFDLLSVSVVLWEGRCAGRARNEMFQYRVVPAWCFARRSYTWQEMQSCFPAMMLINSNSNTDLVKCLVQSRSVLLWQSMRADRLSSLQINGGCLFEAWWCPVKTDLSCHGLVRVTASLVWPIWKLCWLHYGEGWELLSITLFGSLAPPYEEKEVRDWKSFFEVQVWIHVLSVVWGDVLHFIMMFVSGIRNFWCAKSMVSIW